MLRIAPPPLAASTGAKARIMPSLPKTCVSELELAPVEISGQQLVAGCASGVVDPFQGDASGQLHVAAGRLLATTAAAEAMSVVTLPWSG